jgi:hypothetical protein
VVPPVFFVASRDMQAGLRNVPSSFFPSEAVLPSRRSPASEYGHGLWHSTVRFGTFEVVVQA